MYMMKISGFWKTDRLVPSVTVMLYFAPDEWDGPLSLFDMMEVKDPRIVSFIDNFCKDVLKIREHRQIL